MKYALTLALVFTCFGPIAGCGSSADRSALAQKTVVDYWSAIGHGQFKKAYDMNTSGNQGNVKFSDYRSNLIGFLTNIAGVSARAGTPIIADDHATVPIGLQSPKAPGVFNAWQHLFWENGAWKISDQNGGVSRTK